jgi:transposase
MANHLKMASIQAILQLRALRWSQRQIAAKLGIDRGTVARYLQAAEAAPNPAIPPTGSSGAKPAIPPAAPARALGTADRDGCGDSAAGSNPAISPTGSTAVACCKKASPAGRHSACEPHRELILAQLEQGLSAQRIWQDLVADHQFTAEYDSVKRFARRWRTAPAIPFRRLECAAGEQAQVDFGTGAPVIGSDGKRRKTYVFRVVLSYSRKAYSEATFTQTTDDFLRCLENALVYFGGPPKTLIIDNLKAAVAHPDWFDPELTPKVQAFCQHYGTVILPTKPYMPRHKGKVESSVKYVKNNALKGRSFTSLEEQNRFLLDWERTVADTRIHGTTKRQVGKVFVEMERAALLPLCRDRFPCFHEGRRVVARDGHVEVARAYYSVPPEYLARRVWVRWDLRLVRVFNHRWEQIALHVRQEPGRFSTLGEHLHPNKISGLERGAEYLLNKTSLIGPQAHDWAQAMVTARGLEGTRVLQGLLSLAKQHAPQALEKACEVALSHGAFRLRTIRTLLNRPGCKQEPLPFLDEHPIIRPLDDYAQIVARAIERRQQDRPSVGEGLQRHGSGVRAAAENEHSPSSTSRQGCDACSTRPRSEYPSSGCSSAEPDSVSPDSSSLVPRPSFHQE